MLLSSQATRTVIARLRIRKREEIQKGKMDENHYRPGPTAQGPQVGSGWIGNGLILSLYVLRRLQMLDRGVKYPHYSKGTRGVPKHPFVYCTHMKA